MASKVHWRTDEEKWKAKADTTDDCQQGIISWGMDKGYLERERMGKGCEKKEEKKDWDIKERAERVKTLDWSITHV